METKECPLARIGAVISYYNYRSFEQYNSMKIKNSLEDFIKLSALCHKEKCELWDESCQMCSLNNRLSSR